MRSAKEIQLATFCSMLKEHDMREVAQINCDLCYKFKPVIGFDMSYNKDLFYFCEDCIKTMKEKNNER